MSIIRARPRLSDADALALGRLVEPWLDSARVTVDVWGADLDLPSVRLSHDGHLQVLGWIRNEPAPQQQEVRCDG